MKNEVPIFEYHDLSEKPHKARDFHSPYILLKKKFYQQMEWLSKNEYYTLTIDDLLRNDIPEKAVVLTFDDGHISNYKLAFPILKEFNFVATFFIVHNFVGQKNYIAKEHILEMHKEGMKFESHSSTHSYILSLSKEKIIQELRESKEKIESILKSQINYFSVPYGFYNKYLILSLKYFGYKGLVTEDFGYYKLKNSSFQIIPRFTVKSNMTLNKVKNIAEKRKIRLVTDYSVDICLRNLKKLFGYRIYIHLKSLVLKTAAPHISQRL